ncbi:endonuclease-reverse transcriptase, partial [Plakobranchus ocellatus]
HHYTDRQGERRSNDSSSSGGDVGGGGGGGGGGGKVVLDNKQRNREKPKSSGDVVYQKNDEDIMDRKKSNELVLKEANLGRSLIKTLRQRQLQFLGHIRRLKGLEHLAITGKVESKRNRGRQRITFIGSLKSWAIGKGSNNNFIRLTENRYEWKNMIANVCSRQGT